MLVDTSVWVDYFNGYPLLSKDRDFKAIARCRPLAIVAVTETPDDQH